MVAASDKPASVEVAEEGGIPSSKAQEAEGNDAWLTAGIIVADVVGAGILTMPSAVAHLGWLLGGMTMTVMLVANVHISILLWRVRMSVRDTVQCRTYVDLAEVAFAKAPEWQRRVVLLVTKWSQYIFLSVLMGVYLLSAGKGLGMAFYQARLCLPLWAAIAALVLLPFASTARKMGSYQSLVWINIATLCGTVLIPLGYYMIYGTEDISQEDSTVEAVADLSLSGVLYSLSAFTFGMTSQFMLNEIMSEMKDISELPKAYITISAPFQLAAFLVAGLAGYFLIGSEVTGMINENLPFGVSFQVAALCLLTHMLISYLIKGVVIAQVVQSALFPSCANPDDQSMKAKASWAGIVAMIMLFAWLFANLVPFFADAVDLLGASLTPISCWLIPVVLYWRYIKDADGTVPRPGRIETLVLVLEVVVALVLMFVGTYTACQSLMEHWHTFGAPFACHCEGLWDTCECSSGHPGMDACPVVILGNVTLPQGGASR